MGILHTKRIEEFPPLIKLGNLQQIQLIMPNNTEVRSDNFLYIGYSTIKIF